MTLSLAPCPPPLYNQNGSIEVGPRYVILSPLTTAGGHTNKAKY